LLENRKEAVEEKHRSFAEKTAWRLWKRAMLSRSMMNMANGKTKGWVINNFVKDWKKHRSDLVFPNQSFNQQWKKKRKKTN
jgi:L-lactate dehydrogenase complex protein LldF